MRASALPAVSVEERIAPALCGLSALALPGIDGICFDFLEDKRSHPDARSHGQIGSPGDLHARDRRPTPLRGTHRLLQKDVKFKDLGLLIIDEEQRFGVKHKEKLKAKDTVLQWF